MSLSTLMGVPRTLAEFQAWAFANQANHRDIIARVFATTGTQLVEFPLQPFDPNDPDSLQTYLNAHQQMHQDMDHTLGLNTYNLSEVDWQDPSSLAQWVQTHALEHIAASQLLGIS